MKFAWFTRLLLGLLLLMLLPAANAAITCTSITSPGVNINYVNGTTASVQTYFTVSCTRTSAGDPTSVSYDVTADNGLQPTGQNNNAILGGSLLRYDVFTNSSCGTSWKGSRKISDSISWGAGATGTVTKQTSFWGCIVSALTLSNSGNYTDSVGLTLVYNNITLSGSVPVSIYAPALCTVSSAPGTISLNYQAFGPDGIGSTNFALTCTNGMPYTVATDVTESVVVGLRYTLSLSGIGLVGNAANGTGAAQSYTITATIPGGQAGTCTGSLCAGSNTHTLTVTY